jgi:hypothetical protein
MKTTLYYFTATGNSLNVARKLADLLEESELIPIAKVWQQAEILANTENVGFVFPLYFSGVPDIVEQFVKKLELENTVCRCHQRGLACGCIWPTRQTAANQIEETQHGVVYSDAQ